MSYLTITLIQTALHWEDVNANLRMFDQKIDHISGETELVVLPEMFSTGFSMQAEKLAETMEGKTVQWMKQKARQKNIILTGSLIISEKSDSNKAKENYFNRQIWALPDGNVAFYDKRHLFTYAGEDKFYTTGDKRLIARVKGWKIALMVCYDLRFPVWLRQSGPKESWYDLLIVIANWPATRMLAWNTLLQARAIENQCFVAGLNRTGRDGNNLLYDGHSCIIDPLGEVMVKKQEEETLITHTLQKNRISEVRAQYPFLEDTDQFLIL